jgi:hypothetical protein
MSLELSAAVPADAGRIAEIHMAAFGDNHLLRAQFPTPAVRIALQRSIELKALADIEDPKITVLIVRDWQSPEEDEGTVIAFAKWSHPIDNEEYAESPWIWPKGTNQAVLDAWTKKTEVALAQSLGNDPCYRELPNP